MRADHDTGSNHTTADKTPVQQPDADDNVKSTEQIYAFQLNEYKRKHQQRRLQDNEEQNIHPGYHNHDNGSNNRHQGLASQQSNEFHTSQRQQTALTADTLIVSDFMVRTLQPFKLSKMREIFL